MSLRLVNVPFCLFCLALAHILFWTDFPTWLHVEMLCPGVSAQSDQSVRAGWSVFAWNHKGILAAYRVSIKDWSDCAHVHADLSIRWFIDHTGCSGSSRRLISLRLKPRWIIGCLLGALQRLSRLYACACWTMSSLGVYAILQDMLYPGSNSC